MEDPFKDSCAKSDEFSKNFQRGRGGDGFFFILIEYLLCYLAFFTTFLSLSSCLTSHLGRFRLIPVFSSIFLFLRVFSFSATGKAINPQPVAGSAPTSILSNNPQSTELRNVDFATKKVSTWEKHFIILLTTSSPLLLSFQKKTKMRQIWIQCRSAEIWFWTHKVYFVELLWYHWKPSSSHTVLFSFNSLHFSLLILSSILSNNCPKPSPPANLIIFLLLLRKWYFLSGVEHQTCTLLTNYCMQTSALELGNAGWLSEFGRDDFCQDQYLACFVGLAGHTLRCTWVGVTGYYT